MENYPQYQLSHEIITQYFPTLPHPPRQLYIRGNFPTHHQYVFLTVVGSRKATPYGKEACRRLIHELRGYPIVIISGLAAGIDTIAHETALEAGLPMIAFPGSGLDHRTLYPKSSLGLAQKILDAGGALISEYPEATRGNIWTFPARNRLMAALGHATLVIEGAELSGSRMTARLALDYHREVFAVPGSIFSDQSHCPHALIRLGATPITSGQDILEGLGFHITQQPPLDLFTQCSPEEQELLNHLKQGCRRGELLRVLPYSIQKSNTLISSMEMKKLIYEKDGSFFRY